MKRSVCVFTCSSTKKIHPEVVYSLDTDSSWSAIIHFTARRGQPSTIWSDIGTNFVGAQNELKQFASFWQNIEVLERLHQKIIIWEFNPAAASHSDFLQSES